MGLIILSPSGRNLLAIVSGCTLYRWSTQSASVRSITAGGSASPISSLNLWLWWRMPLFRPEEQFSSIAAAVADSPNPHVPAALDWPKRKKNPDQSDDAITGWTARLRWGWHSGNTSLSFSTAPFYEVYLFFPRVKHATKMHVDQDCLEGAEMNGHYIWSIFLGVVFIK